jgi:hypothetical protein
MSIIRTILVVAAILGASAAGAANYLTVDEFRRELVGLPLCGTPATGLFAGKMLCTVHLPDGTAVVAGFGILARGMWEADAGRICRRNANDPSGQLRCVEYEKVGPDRYRNSDGVEMCIGPCPPAEATAPPSPAPAVTQEAPAAAPQTPAPAPAPSQPSQQ